MSDDQLYELAKRRIDRRNRRWMLLAVDIFAFMLFVGAFVSSGGAIPHNLGMFIALAWCGALVLHVFILKLTQNRDEAIEGEIAKLRDALYDEKPKRLELGDDGELTEIIGDDVPEAQRKRS